MYTQCQECHQTFEPEPGFYYGAMFVSYIFSAIITLVTGFILYSFFNDPSIIVYIGAVAIVVIILSPLMYRYSRSIFLHIFGGIRYNPKHA